MAVGPQPSKKPSPPRRPPNDRAGMGDSYHNEKSKMPQKYGSSKDCKEHTGGSQFPGVGGGFKKAGSKSGAGY